MNESMPLEVTTEMVECFVNKCQELVSEYFAKHFPTLVVPTITFENGKRYVRIIKGDGNYRTVFAFLDTETGNVLKPDGWKKPAKHARGNLHDADNGMKYVSAHGVAYLK